MSEYIDKTDGTVYDDADMHERYDEWLNDLYGEINIGHSVFEPAEILKELEPITYNVGFSDYLSFASEDGDIISMDDSPECEDCGEKMDRDEIVTALADHDRLMCESCGEDEDDDDDDDACNVCGVTLTEDDDGPVCEDCTDE